MTFLDAPQDAPRNPQADDELLGRPLDPQALCLSEEQLQQAARQVDASLPEEEQWSRYLRLQALQALKLWKQQQHLKLLIGPETDPEEPTRLLALNQKATQLLCSSPLQEEVAVPLACWRDQSTAPQLLLLAQVDEENGVVQFPGVLEAQAFIAEVHRRNAAEQQTIELPETLFRGGLERLLRWLTLLEPEALPRAGLVA
ncbi:MAG: hypothetical protein VKI83_02675, partial [Synechococcaceae cyanobacterium]|nr:hypothetical protein [Synechococcaceae cyanobacterium]